MCHVCIHFITYTLIHILYNLIIRCHGVYKEPYNIGCDNEHIFCKTCLDDYFTPNNSVKSCPSCRHEGLSKNDIKPGRFVKRVVNSLKIECPLQLKQNTMKINVNGIVI